MIRVLIVDDSVVFRKILQEALSKHPKIKVVGTATNGREGLQKIRVLKPDVTVLDVEMPQMDGLTTLEAIKKQKLSTVVIMFSTLTSQGAQTTLEALQKGAADFVPKPSGTGAFAQSVKTIQEQLIPKIVALGNSSSRQAAVANIAKSFASIPKCRNLQKETRGAQQEAAHSQRASRARPLLKRPAKIEAVAIGVSTGGPNALNHVVPMFPANFKLPIFIVQHMPPVFTAQLAARLDNRSKLTVVEATNGMKVTGGTVYIAPGDYHMTVARQNAHYVIRLNQDPPENSCRPAVDVLFRSLANAYGNRVIATVMTGMGKDGLKGSEELKKKGALILAQDKETSTVWGMPKFVTEAGLADRVVPLKAITPTILELAGHRY